MKRALAYVALLLLLGAFAQSGTAYAPAAGGYYQGIGNGMKK